MIFLGKGKDLLHDLLIHVDLKGAWAAANGVTEGIGGGLFGSDNDCTRGQIVTFLYRAYNK